MDENTATNFSEAIPQSVGAPDADPSLPMYLIVLAGGIPGAMIRLAQGGTRIGRGTDNTMQLTEGSVSRYHAVLRTGDDGRVRMTDLASTNGTQLNGRRIANHTPTVLHDGDRLQFGSAIVLKFVRPDPCEEEFQRAMFERTVRDSLTGLYNRSYFLDQVGTLGRHAAQRGLGLAILMVDIDHFKQINDTYGHDGGDTVLRDVAAVIRQSTRAEDLVARYGGEEFIVALPAATPDLASARAERIRRNLANRRITVGGQSVRVTASIGLAFSPASRPRAVEGLIAAADLCLYQAKNAGRDRLVSSPGAGVTVPEPPTRDDGSYCGTAFSMPMPHNSLTADGEV